MKKILFSLIIFIPSCVVHANADDYQQQHVFHEAHVPIVKSVAIIGGGASGTSTAFWLNNVFSSSSENSPNQISITIFDRKDYIGGRSTTVPIKGNSSLGTMELGASIFVEANQNLMKATDKFGLKRTSVEVDDDNDDIDPLVKKKREDRRPGLGVWDGEQFVFEETGSYYWDSLKALWRYGLSPIKFQRKQQEIVKRFLNIYNETQQQDEIMEIVKDLGLKELVNMTAESYLKDLGINDRFSYEILQTATRGNYCQDLNALHALAVMVSMEASHGTWAVEDGNYRIFEEFASRSGADLQLNTKVVSISNITEVDTNGHHINRYRVETLDGKNQVFDEVVLAAPLKYSGIEFSFPTEEEQRDYHAVHVTLVAGYPDPSYFGRTIDHLPSFIVTTGLPLIHHFENKTAPFNTFSVHRYLENGESVIKLFSPKVMEEEFLDQLFINRSWTYRTAWHAFPKLKPIADNHSFPSFILKPDKENDDFGIIYTGAFENFISTMETQTIAGKIAAKVLYKKWCNTFNEFNKYCGEFGDGWGKI
ncbi:Prenylcysteine lyase-domain-containing protein [Cokeromyces recurvatus]|uniref:Prenylcysteine lyase-domain-containing protein n=1 Tax=Cokeromyces recurvatus TaxID=90255 RepID=UPI00221F47F8|nr:Prenylcysteine lyase-domain-containing protein [Cokeromyces recurvatus]KAI7907608.1 Prenylcysteine lyase-domain-containing protein [Cokeromyces recurvatus]